MYEEPHGVGEFMPELLSKKELKAFALAPLFSVLPLLPWFCIPRSPLFLGKLVPEIDLNIGVALFAVVFDGTILAYVVEVLFALPVYLLLRKRGWSKRRLYLLGCVSGIAGSIIVMVLQNFRQAALREFAMSSLSPLFGIACGVSAAFVFWRIMRGTVQPTAA